MIPILFVLYRPFIILQILSIFSLTMNFKGSIAQHTDEVEKTNSF